MSTPMQTVKAEESKFVAWIKRDWAHFVTWLGLAYGLLKHL